MLTARQYKKLNANHSSPRPSELYQFEAFVKRLILAQFGDWDVLSTETLEQGGKVYQEIVASVNLKDSKAGVHKITVNYSGNSADDLGIDDWAITEFLYKV